MRRTRGVVALPFAIITAYAAARGLHVPNWPTAFDQLWDPANALREGNDPYPVVGRAGNMYPVDGFPDFLLLFLILFVFSIQFCLAFLR